MKKIRDLPQDERPREKLKTKGPEALSDQELLAILLGSGTKGHNVMTVAQRILKALDTHNEKLNLDVLEKLEGVGPAKATLISAALELGRRRIRPEGLKISFPADVLPLLHNYGDRKQEHFICISLNGAHEVVATRVVSVGLLNKTQVHPREVFSDPITDRAAAIIIAHNHPSGELIPSSEDIQVTRQLKAAGELLGIHLLDHIIFNHKGYYSFLEKKGL